MRKYLFLLATAAIFAACSSDNDPALDSQNKGDEEVAIGFGSSFVSKTTRGEITTDWFKTNGNSFGVYGFKYGEDNAETVQLYTNEKVTYNNNDWSNPTKRYWDKSVVSDYHFYAYAPYSDAAGVVSFTRTGASAGDACGFTYKLGNSVVTPADDADAIDLVVARVINTDYNQCYYPGTSTASDGHVTFIFHHALSKLSFEVKKDEELEDMDIVITDLDVAFPTVGPDGDITWVQDDKDNDGGNVIYNGLTEPDKDTQKDPLLDDGDQEVTGTKAPVDGVPEYIVTPSEDGESHTIEISVTYEITYPDGTKETQTSTGEIVIDFDEDGHYTVIINIKPALIEFDVQEVEDWTNKTTTF